MKKLFIIPIIVALSTFTVTAQDISDNAIGLRFGGGNGLGTEVSYQRALSNSNRLEVDLGLESNNNSSAFKLTGVYQWVWALEGNFNWYAGAGGGIGSISYDNDFPGLKDGDDSETFLYAAGQVGIEYNFDIPLQLSLDTRPELSFAQYGDNLRIAIALGVRYRF